jgi:sulfite exporter TauE/SafE
VIVEPQVAAALLAGFLGSTHCVAMCGGIVGALGAGLGRADENRGRASMSKIPKKGVSTLFPLREKGTDPFFAFSARFPFLLAYNGGRISSYVVAGAIAGALGAGAGSFFDIHTAHRIGRIVGALFLAGFGLYLFGITAVLGPLERAGEKIWRRVEPLGRRFLPPKHLGQALGLGLVWGWLPCGLVYSTLALAATAGSPAAGLRTMLAFGLGTLPMLLAMGLASEWIARATRNIWIRRVSGVALMALAVIMLVGGGPVGHTHVHPEH